MNLLVRIKKMFVITGKHMDKIQFHEENKQFAFYLDCQLDTEKFKKIFRM